MIHKCKYCDYESVYKPNMRRHQKNKHGNQQNESQLKTSHMQGYPQLQSAQEVQQQQQPI